MTNKNIQDVYPLSAAQEGILFHSAYAPGTGVYVTQMSCGFRNLNVAALEQAWQEVTDRHSILRTAFVWENLKRPLQVVGLQVRPQWERGNWRGLSTKEQEERLETYLIEDRRRGFNLSKAPLMRLSLFELDEASFYFVWSHHHLILDGWSIFLIFKEVRTLYETLCRGEKLKLAPARPYRDYIAWLQQQDLSQAKAFWQKMLSGGCAPLNLGKEPAANNLIGEEETHEESWVRLTAAETADLQALARPSQLTLNTLVQGAWALVLSHCSGQKDVSFGVTGSGRPADLEGIESMAGLFINILPTRVRVSPESTLLPWLKNLQEQQAAMRHYDYSPLTEIQRWVEVRPGQPLFESILTWQNYPIDNSLREQSIALEVSNVRHYARNNYPLTLIASPRNQLILQLKHDPRRFEIATINRLRGSLEALLRGLAAQSGATLGELDEYLDRAELNLQISQEKEHEEATFQKFKRARPKKTSFTQGKLFRTEYLSPDQTLPLIILPTVDDVSPVNWAAGNRDLIESEFLKHGAILFRGFPLKSIPEFEQFASALCLELYGEYGDLPRAEVGGRVYGSTPYPHDQPILFHNESSHLHRWPAKICFFCVTAASAGGETPIVDCRKVFQSLDPEISERFRQKGIMYVRNFVDGLDVNWQSFFRTNDKSAVEQRCREMSISYEWTDSNGLRICRVSPAVIEHPRTRETVFFNQLQLHHPGCLDPAVRESLLSVFREEELPRNAFYGDGSRIEDRVMEEIGRLYHELSVSFPWRAGDVLLLDNMLTAHGRNPFAGEREIVVTMGEMVTADEFETNPVLQ